MAAVYLIYQNRLFGDAIRAILATRPDIHLLGATDRPQSTGAEIAALAPGVILLEELEDGSPICDLQQLLASPTSARLITLRLDQNGMQVWSRTRRRTVGPQDLLDAIATAPEDEP